MPKSPHHDEMEQILKKIQQESAEKKKEQALKILQRQPNSASTLANLWQQFTHKYQHKFQGYKKEFVKQTRLGQNKHLLIISLFFFGAVYLSWSIEDKYDKIRARVYQTKTQQEREVEVENQYINKMLAKNPFEPVPIDQEEEEDPSYIFQKTELQFDTSADLLEVLEEEKRILDDANYEKDKQ